MILTTLLMLRDTSTFGSSSRQRLSNSQYEKRTNSITNLDAHLLSYDGICINELKSVYMALVCTSLNALFVALGHC